MLCCVFDTAQAPTVCLWSLGPSLPQPWRRQGEAPVSRRLSWVPGSPWSLEAALLASPVAPPCHQPAPAVTSRQPPLLGMGTRVRGGGFRWRPWTRTTSRVLGHRPALPWLPPGSWHGGYPQDGAKHSPALGKGAARDLFSLLLHSPTTLCRTLRCCGRKQKPDAWPS